MRSSAPSAETFAILFRAVHPIVVKAHPSAMVPSEKSSMSQMVLLEFGLKAASMVPLALSRATRLRAVAAILVKVPPTRIWLSGSSASV